MLAVLKSGKLATIIPHGVLFMAAGAGTSRFIGKATWKRSSTCPQSLLRHRHPRHMVMNGRGQGPQACCSSRRPRIPRRQGEPAEDIDRSSTPAASIPPLYWITPRRRTARRVPICGSVPGEISHGHYWSNYKGLRRVVQSGERCGLSGYTVLKDKRAISNVANHGGVIDGGRFLDHRRLVAKTCRW